MTATTSCRTTWRSPTCGSRARSSSGTYLIQEKVLGLEIPVQSYMPRSHGDSLFVIYAIASYLYRWVVTFSILFFLYQFLKPYHLGSISAMMAVGSLVPLVGDARLSDDQVCPGHPGRMRKVKKVRDRPESPRPSSPLSTGRLDDPDPPSRSRGRLVLTPANPALVYSETPGRLDRLGTQGGRHRPRRRLQDRGRPGSRRRYGQAGRRDRRRSRTPRNFESAWNSRRNTNVNFVTGPSGSRP